MRTWLHLDEPLPPKDHPPIASARLYSILDTKQTDHFFRMRSHIFLLHSLLTPLYKHLKMLHLKIIDIITDSY